MRNFKFADWIGIISGIIGIISALLPIVLKGNYDIRFAFIVVAMMVAYVLWENRSLKMGWQRKEKYVDIFGLLNRVYSPLYKLPAVDKSDTEEIESLFKECLTRLTEVLSQVTKCKICASLKIITGNVNILGYKAGIDTFARDNNSYPFRGNPIYPRPMIIDENSDFKQIYQRLINGSNTPPHFFCNNLPLEAATRGYQNSRLGPESDKAVHGPDSYNTIKKIWPLEYRSTIVVPIFSLNAGKEYDIFGFLCVDCSSTDVFLESDVDILYGLADAIYVYRDYIKVCY